jgi:hypothetical protein
MQDATADYAVLYVRKAFAMELKRSQYQCALDTSAVDQIRAAAMRGSYSVQGISRPADLRKDGPVNARITKYVAVSQEKRSIS